jgi:hypothetical protein
MWVLGGLAEHVFVLAILLRFDLIISILPYIFKEAG